MAANSETTDGDLVRVSTYRGCPAQELRLDGFHNGNGGGTGEERDGKGGMMDPRVSALAGAGANGARYKTMSPARLPITRAPCLTIPPGFSPSALLDSPVLLTNIKAEPSPTTGSFNMSGLTDKAIQSSTLPSLRDASNLRGYDRGGSVAFEFKPHFEESYSSGLSSPGPMAYVGQKNGFHDNFQNPSQGQQGVNSTCPDAANKMSNSKANLPNEVPSEEFEQMKDSDKSMQGSQVDTTESVLSNPAEKSAEDGYNWRKYGQKHVKGSEYPRSYYKCTHPNCQVKKQLERSHNGQITEIIYKGSHDHPKPQPNRRLAVGSILSNQSDELSERISSLTGSEDKLTNAPSHVSHQLEPTGLAELSPASASDDDVEQSKTGDEIVDDDDPEAKRRKIGITSIDATTIGKMNREPRVVVQTVSEVDILDDGYRWRKYGQKVVKGNPNPRSYYKCTSVGCPVRKHVERASHDPKAVITTYEGKHNHDVPAARTTSHEASSLASTEAATVLPSHMPASLTSMIRNCSTRVIHPYAQPADSDTISLDLGVGICPNQGNTITEKQQALATNQIHHHQGHDEMVHGNPFSTLYTSSDSGTYDSRENKGEVFTFSTPPINNTSNVYYSSTGNLVMGP